MLSRSHNRSRAESMPGPPGPTYMDNKQVASYLQEIRNGPPRPSGNRLPSFFPPVSSHTVYRHVKPTPEPNDLSVSTSSPPPRVNSALSHRDIAGAGIKSTLRQGRPLRPSSSLDQHRERDPSAPSASKNARATNQSRTDELREAANIKKYLDLERQARNAERNPEMVKRALRKKGTHVRAHSYDVSSSQSSASDRNSTSSSRSSSSSSVKARHPATTLDTKKTNAKEEAGASQSKPTKLPSKRDRPRVTFNDSPTTITTGNSVLRPIAGPRPDSKPKASDKHGGLTPSLPADQEHESTQPSSKLPLRVRANPFARMQSTESTSKPPKRFEPIEIHRNAPSQSRNPAYTSNEIGSSVATTQEAPAAMKRDMEIRNLDIRAATSRKFGDRSAKLPTPSMVSDSLRRPIVSFQRSYRSNKAALEMQSPDPGAQPKPYSPSPRETKESPGAPVIPDLVMPPSIAIDFSDLSQPGTLGMSGPERASARPLPDPKAIRSGPAPPSQTKTTNKPLSNKYHAPAERSRNTGLCEACALPMTGHTFVFDDARFHSECFRCYHCSEALECIAFYPEPGPTREKRLDRIMARRNGEHVEPAEGCDEADDGDESLRFYCHLDYHEFFSPRCKSCKTPIEGEAIMACGAMWHVGHFFCAQCGDPFDSSTSFVEKDGYAWCTNCHTNRYSTKCKKCRKPVTDTVLKALGFEWHPNCFVCTECSGEFVDGRYFSRGEEKNAVCVSCEERRLKA